MDSLSFLNVAVADDLGERCRTIIGPCQTRREHYCDCVAVPLLIVVPRLETILQCSPVSSEFPLAMCS